MQSNWPTRLCHEKDVRDWNLSYYYICWDLVDTFSKEDISQDLYWMPLERYSSLTLTVKTFARIILNHVDTYAGMVGRWQVQFLVWISLQQRNHCDWLNCWPESLLTRFFLWSSPRGSIWSDTLVPIEANKRQDLSLDLRSPLNQLYKQTIHAVSFSIRFKSKPCHLQKLLPKLFALHIKPQCYYPLKL